jgi:hypothetical protein
MVSANRSTAIVSTGLIVVAIGSGCGTTQKVAVGSMTPILEQTVESVYRDQDLETVEQGLPANLLLVRGMAEADPGNARLGALASQLYFYYGFGFVEPEDPERAALIYAQGMTIGRRLLDRKDWFRPERAIDAFREGLDEAGKDDVPAMFWLSANWTSWINMNLDDPAIVADLPLAEALLDRVLALDPGYFEGMPEAMAGTLAASKPVLMGGDPPRAKRHFDEAFRISGRRMLIFNTLYAQSYCRQTLDVEEFERTLDAVLETPPGAVPEYRLLNELARRRATRLLEKKDEWF